MGKKKKCLGCIGRDAKIADLEEQLGNLEEQLDNAKSFFRHMAGIPERAVSTDRVGRLFQSGGEL